MCIYIYILYQAFPSINDPFCFQISTLLELCCCWRCCCCCDAAGNRCHVDVDVVFYVVMVWCMSAAVVFNVFLMVCEKWSNLHQSAVVQAISHRLRLIDRLNRFQSTTCKQLVSSAIKPIQNTTFTFRSLPAMDHIDDTDEEHNSKRRRTSSLIQSFYIDLDYLISVISTGSLDQ